MWSVDRMRPCALNRHHRVVLSRLDALPDNRSRFDICRAGGAAQAPTRIRSRPAGAVLSGPSHFNNERAVVDLFPMTI